MAGKSFKKVVESAMPGWELLENVSRYREDPDGVMAAPNQVGVDIELLRRKYIKPRATARMDGFSGAPDPIAPSPPVVAAVPAERTRLARVRNKSLPVDSVVGTKAVLFDLATDKIIGQQG